MKIRLNTLYFKIKSQTTIGKYNTEGNFKPYRYRGYSNRYRISELLKNQSKRYPRAIFFCYVSKGYLCR